MRLASKNVESLFSGTVTITAAGRGDWVGTLELRPEQIAERPILNTARVISDTAPDVLAVVEAEDRPSLTMFNDDILPRVGSHRFRHLMLIDGNDGRGIDVGLMTRVGYPIGQMRSHVDDLDGKRVPLFSRDCPEFTIMTPSGITFLLLVNHLKSKGYGGRAASDRRRKEQASRVAEIYRDRRAAGIENIAIVGDLNDTPDSDALSPLLARTDLNRPRVAAGSHCGVRPPALQSRGRSQAEAPRGAHASGTRYCRKSAAGWLTPCSLRRIDARFIASAMLGK